MENAVNQRIRQILKLKKMTNRSLSKVLGMPEVTLNAKLNGRNRIDIDTFCSIIDVFDDISIEWLLTGRGEMLRRNETTVNNAYANNGAASVFGDANNNSETNHLMSQIESLKEQIESFKEQVDDLKHDKEKLYKLLIKE